MTATVAALCMGYGGLEMGLRLAGIDAGLAWCAEIDPHASKVIAHRWPGVPNLGDLTKITDPTPVDIVTAGFPCTDISLAGRRAGLEGERSGVWWNIADLVGDLRPRRVVLENVAAISTLGGTAVVGSLAAMGYRVRWGTLRAAAVGAPHGRARWFAVADAQDDGHERGGPARRRGHGPADGGHAAPDADGLATGRVARATSRAEAGRQDEPLEPVGDRLGHGCRTADTFGPYAAAVARWERVLGRRAPDPTTDGRLSPMFVEWMMGLPEGHVTDVPDLSRAQMLRALGNGVVPQQAAAAIGALW